jgi:hypothetical protein
VAKDASTLIVTKINLAKPRKDVHIDVSRREDRDRRGTRKESTSVAFLS